jgi:hypothetical protein
MGCNLRSNRKKNSLKAKKASSSKLSHPSLVLVLSLRKQPFSPLALPLKKRPVVDVAPVEPVEPVEQRYFERSPIIVGSVVPTFVVVASTVVAFLIVASFVIAPPIVVAPVVVDPVVLLFVVSFVVVFPILVVFVVAPVTKPQQWNVGDLLDAEMSIANNYQDTMHSVRVISRSKNIRAGY